MPTLLRIGVLYGAPVVALLVAIVAFVVLFRRVRRGALDRGRAAALYATTLLLPIAVVLLVWGAAELASYLAVGGDQYTWNREASIDFLVGLVPLGLYVAAPIVAMVVGFAATMVLSRSRRDFG